MSIDNAMTDNLLIDQQKGAEELQQDENLINAISKDDIKRLKAFPTKAYLPKHSLGGEPPIWSYIIHLPSHQEKSTLDEYGRVDQYLGGVCTYSCDRVKMTTNRIIYRKKKSQQAILDEWKNEVVQHLTTLQSLAEANVKTDDL